MSTETRDRIAVRMDQETSQRLEQWYIADNCKSKNEFILKAMNFYIDYLEVQDNKTLLPTAVTSPVYDLKYCISVTSTKPYKIYYMPNHEQNQFIE